MAECDLVVRRATCWTTGGRGATTSFCLPLEEVGIEETGIGLRSYSAMPGESRTGKFSLSREARRRKQ